VALKRTIMHAATVLATCLAIPASAQPAAPAPTSGDAGEQAYQRGRQHYDLQEWDAAIAEFKEAYRLRQDAASLFNIAQSYRLKGDCAQAASFYKTYKRNFPNEKNIARVDQFIGEMDECAKHAPATTITTTPQTTTSPSAESPSTSSPTTSSPATPSPATTPPPMLAPHDTQSRGSLSLVGVGIAGTGAACVLGGVLFGLHAQTIEHDIQAMPIWDPDLNRSGERADLAAKILLVAGGAAVIGGATVIVLGYHDHESAQQTSLRVVPSSQGASVWWSGSF
jgi:tetratricopeptide (TPR) repeat protein